MQQRSRQFVRRDQRNQGAQDLRTSSRFRLSIFARVERLRGDGCRANLAGPAPPSISGDSAEAEPSRRTEPGFDGSVGYLAVPPTNICIAHTQFNLVPIGQRSQCRPVRRNVQNARNRCKYRTQVFNNVGKVQTAPTVCG